MGQSNLVAVIIPEGELSVIQQQLLRQTGAEIGPEGLKYRNREYSGDYFALIKCPNPFNKEKLALAVIIKDIMAGKTLLDLFINFDYNPLFFNDVIIYHNNNYSTFRMYYCN